MPQFLYAVVQIFELAFATSATAGAFATFAALVLKTVIINTALRALSGRPKQAGAQPQELTLAWSMEPGIIIFGQRRVSGMVIFEGTSGDKNLYLHVVIALAIHQCEAIDDIYFDNERIQTSEIDGTTGQVTGGRYATKAYIFKHLGADGQTVDTVLDAAFPEWSSDHRGRGICNLHCRLTHDDKVWDTGVPRNYFAVTKGVRVYDPRLDSTNGGSGSHRYTDATTWAWSNNPKLCQAFYLTGGSLVFDVNTAAFKGHLGFGTDPTNIDWPSVIAAANIDDESLSGGSAPPSGAQVRFTCDGVLSTGNQLADNMNQLLTADAGQVVFGSGKYKFYSGAYDTPTLPALTENDLAGDIHVVGALATDDRYNAVDGRYFSNVTWQWQDFKPREDSSFVTRDAGRQKFRTIELPFTTDEYRAQRIAELHLNQSDNQAVIQWPGKLSCFKVGLWETVQINIVELGYVNAVFRCTDREVIDEGRVDLSFRAESTGAYAAPATGDYLSPSAPSDPGNTTDVLAAPTNFTATGGPSSIVFGWTLPSPYVAGTLFELYEYTAATSFGDATLIATIASNTYTLPRSDTTQEYYWVRAIRGRSVSDNVPSTSGLPGKAASLGAALAATASLSSIQDTFSTSTTHTSPSTTVTPTGGTSPYTHAWTRISGSTDISVDSSTAATTTFSVVSMTDGLTKSAIFRDTVTDNVSATYAVDIAIEFVRDDPGDLVTAPVIHTTRFALDPADATASFQINANGKYYQNGSVVGDWVVPNGSASLYESQVTKTAGSAFTSGADNTWQALSTSRTWTNTQTNVGEHATTFTIKIRLASSGVVQSTTINNDMTALVDA